MLSLLFAWIALGISSLVLGSVLVAVAGWPSHLDSRPDRSLTATWIGLFGLGSLLLALALWTPLTPWLLALPLVGLAVPAVRRILIDCWPNRQIAGLFLAFAIALTPIESASSTLYDTGFYHSQLIAWMSAHGLPPGIGLVHFRMGFSSSWLAIAAVFSHGSLASRMDNVASGFAVVVLLVQLSFALERAFSPQARAIDRFSVIAIPLLLAQGVLLTFIKSPSPNFGVGVAVLVTAWLLIPGPSSLALLTSAASVPLKIIIAPGMLATLDHSFFSRKRFAVLSLAAVSVLPVGMANFRTTGCPAFPTAICLESPSSLPASALDGRTMETVNWARNGGTDFGASYWDLSWVSGWLHYDLNPYFLVISGVSLLIVAITRTWNRALSLAMILSLYLLVTAPDLRFATAEVAIFAGCAGMALWARIATPAILHRSATAWGLVGAAMVLALGRVGENTLIRNTQDPRSAMAIWKSRAIAPAPAFRYAATPRKKEAKGFEYFLPPEDDRCGAIPIPCTPYPIGPEVTYCNPSAGPRGGYCRR